MRLSRFVTLFVGLAAITACGDDEITDPGTPPLAGVRFINALSDTGAVDVSMIDAVNWSFSNIEGYAYRAGSEHQPIAAGARQIRVFPNSTNPAIASTILLEASITFNANTNYTLLLTGSARGNTESFVLIEDTPPATAANQIALRVVNVAAAAIDAYSTATATTAIAPPATATNVATIAPSPYVVVATGGRAIRVTPAGSGTVSASAAGPAAAAPLPGQLPAAGVTSSGTAFSVYYFPAGVPGSVNAPATGATSCAGATPLATCNPTVIWFVDRVPTS
jgi:uncharacterized protein DUF4397